MNIELRRYGIVIKSTPVSGDKASIGSGADCDILIDDPYLSAHVGDLVRRGETWYIVDAGTSLDGITRDGERIDDEAIVAGGVYSIGGFELVAQLPAAAPTGVTEATDERWIPGTIVESVAVPRRANADIPGTMMDSVPVPGRETGIPRTLYEMPMPPQSRAVDQGPQASIQRPTAAPAARPASRRRILLLASVFAMGLILLLLLLVSRGNRNKPVATRTVAATESAAAAKVAPPVRVVPPASPEDLLASLKYDDALVAWEKQLAKADDPATRARYASLALEIGRIHAANQSPDARRYFESAVRLGPAGSEAVTEARRRSGS